MLLLAVAKSRPALFERVGQSRVDWPFFHTSLRVLTSWLEKHPGYSQRRSSELEDRGGCEIRSLLGRRFGKPAIGYFGGSNSVPRMKS